MSNGPIKKRKFVQVRLGYIVEWDLELLNSMSYISVQWVDPLRRELDSVNLIWPTLIIYLATPWVNQLPHPGRSEALRRP